MRNLSSVDLKLVSSKDNILRQQAPLWDFNNPTMEPKSLIDGMQNIMLANGGIGLAAPQVGILQRVFIMGDQTNLVTCFNPEILEFGQESVKLEEGCLSFAGLYLPVERPSDILVRYQDIDGNFVEQRFKDIWSRCFQHELDHLNGICFTKHVSRIVLDMAERRKIKKLKGK